MADSSASELRGERSPPGPPRDAPWRVLELDRYSGWTMCICNTVTFLTFSDQPPFRPFQALGPEANCNGGSIFGLGGGAVAYLRGVPSSSSPGSHNLSEVEVRTTFSGTYSVRAI